MSPVMMGCGHAANAQTLDGEPACVICAGLAPGARVVVAPPDLAGRMSLCAQCGRTTPSALNLPFFRHDPEGQDSHYCGCRGWD